MKSIMLLSFRNRLEKRILLKITRKVTKDARTKPFSIYAIFLIICLFGTLTKKERNFVFYTSIFVEVSVLCNVSQSSLYKKNDVRFTKYLCILSVYSEILNNIFTMSYITKRKSCLFYAKWSKVKQRKIQQP